MSKIDLAREAVVAAVRLRSEHGYGPNVGLCPFDLAQKLGLSARLVNVPSMEGMYSPSPMPTILVNSERPAGRKRYTCGHELGHHIFKHGFRLDELDGSNSASDSPEEVLAQRFSGALLMPKLAVQSAFVRRGWSLPAATPDQIFVVSQELGVGYTTLILHLELSLNLITGSKATQLKSVPLSKIRSSIAGFDPAFDVFHVDANWIRESVDVEVGDVLIVPEGASIDGNCATIATAPARHVQVTKQGTSFLNLDKDKKIPLRVSQRNFVGLAKFRFLEEVEDDV